MDKHNRLDEKPFSYRVTKDNTILISWRNKQVKIIKGKEADKIVNKVSQMEEDERNAQLIIAKITGNFKRGNERTVNPRKK